MRRSLLLSRVRPLLSLFAGLLLFCVVIMVLLCVADPSVSLLKISSLYVMSSDELLTVHISESSNVDERGKWQMEQVEEYCKRYERESELFTFPDDTAPDDTTPSPRWILFRHLIFDDERNFIYCFVPKIGCTTLRRAFLAMQEAIPKETVGWLHVDEMKYLFPGGQKASFLNEHLNDSQRLFKMKNYWKFVFLRNPLERLLSAYLNKLSKPLAIESQKTPSKFGAVTLRIIQRYNPDLVRRWRYGLIQNISLDYETYLRWIVDTPSSELNEHFAPVISLIQPCRVRYNFYANFKMFESDLNNLIDYLNLPRDMFANRTSYHSPGAETRDKMRDYYSTVEHEVKEKLLEDLSEELDFYFTLFPEEAGSHLDLLDVTQF